MKKLGVIVLVLFCNQLFAQEDAPKPEKLKKFKFDWVKVKLPQNFVPMEDEAFFRTTASAVKPEISYRDPSGLITFTVNNTINRWGDNLSLYQQFQRANILSMHKKVEYERDVIIEKKKRKYLVMAFDSKVDDKITPDGKKRVIKNYSCMIYTVKDGYMVTMVLRMPTWLKDEEWKETTNMIINSITVK